MIILPIQWYGYRGSLQSLKITLEIDESIDIGDFNPAKIKTGSQYMMLLIPYEESLGDMLGREETPEETKVRFSKMLHAKIDEIAKSKGRKKEDIKEELKKKLKAEKKIISSTTELDISGLSYALYLLQQINDG